MAAPEEKKDRTPDQAKADAKQAINDGATKVALKRQDDGNWTVTITKP